MSKSDPNSAIFMEDEAADVERKIKKAFCPPQARTALSAAILRRPLLSGCNAAHACMQAGSQSGP